MTEIKHAHVLVRFDHVASFIVNANHSAMRAAVELFPRKTFVQSEPGMIPTVAARR
jgi:hypothetical protein